MTRKVYKSAMGKTVDLGALLLQNEQVRAVGNMGVNAAGDIIDSNNRVIDQRNRQVQRQYKRQTNVSNIPVATSNLSARKQKLANEATAEPEVEINFEESQFEPAISAPEPVQTGAGGLAAAMARSREVKQELEKTLRQRQQEQGVRKI
jgi:hypothetical protein